MVAKNWGFKYHFCLNCKNTDRPHKARGMCSKCHPILLKQICSLCNKYNVIARKIKENTICQSCNKKLFTPIKKRECDVCKKVSRIDKILNNKSLCFTCYNTYYYKRPTKECFNCKEIKVPRGYKENKPYCFSCYYYKFYKKPKFICGLCNKLAHTSAIVNGKRQCHSCYKKLRKEHFIALKLGWRDKRKNYLSDEEIKKILERDQKCVYCNSKNNLTFDHIIPIAKGGKSDLNNLVIACKSCNFSKNKSDVFQWCKRKSIEIPKIVMELINNGAGRGKIG